MDRGWTTQLRKGLTELTVLAALRDTHPASGPAAAPGFEGEAYGYELLQRLAKTELLATTPATLYPVLARLADERKISVREAPSPAGPPRRYYRLTPAGRQQLADMIDHWDQLSAALNAILSPSPPVPATPPLSKEPSHDAS